MAGVACAGLAGVTCGADEHVARMAHPVEADGRAGLYDHEYAGSVRP